MPHWRDVKVDGPVKCILNSVVTYATRLESPTSNRLIDRETTIGPAFISQPGLSQAALLLVNDSNFLQTPDLGPKEAGRKTRSL